MVFLWMLDLIRRGLNRYVLCMLECLSSTKPLEEYVVL